MATRPATSLDSAPLPVLRDWQRCPLENCYSLEQHRAHRTQHGLPETEAQRQALLDTLLAERFPTDLSDPTQEQHA